MFRRSGLLVLSLAILACTVVHAQTTGGIAGRIVDQTGAAISGVYIVVNNTSTGQIINLRTGNAGQYATAVLPVGNYTIRFDAPGFSATVVTNIAVIATETVRADAVLRVASSGETVTIAAYSGMLRRDGPTLGRAVSNRVATALPLTTRNFTQILALSPGTAAFLSDATGVGKNTQPVSVNGARVTENNYRINGVDANTLGTNGPVLLAVPAPETIEEFKVQTSLCDATCGRAGGGNIQILTRSGTGQFHGRVYEYFGNDALNANDGFLKAARVPRPTLRRNIFGATAGGPVRLHKAFFFVSYQGMRETNGASLVNSISPSVVIAPQLTNDRSEATLASEFHLRGPVDARSLALLNAMLPNGAYLIPTPSPNGTFTASTPSTFREDQFNANVDLQATNSDSVSVKFFFANSSPRLSLPSFRGTGPNVPGFSSDGTFNNRIVSVEQVHAFSIRFANVARIGYSFNRNNTTPDEPLDDTQVGIQRSTAAAYPGLPLVRIAPNTGGIIFGTAPAVAGRAAVWTGTLSDTITAVRGDHTLRAGGEMRWNGNNYRIPNTSRGQIDFASFTTFLLGQVQSSTLGTGVVGRAWRARDFDLFVQDDWSIRPRLTINLGLRYELDPPVQDTLGRLSTFDPRLYAPRMATSNGVPVGPPAAGFVQAGNVTSAFETAGVPRVADGIADADRFNLAPRLGFAWSPFSSDNVVVRAGYGLFYSRATFQYASLTDRLPPDYVLATKANTSFADPFFNLPPANTFPTFITGVPLSGSPFDPRLHVPRFQQLNVGVQYAPRHDLVAEIAYVGSRGSRLFQQLAINQARLATATNPVVNQVTGQAITTNTPANAALRAPLQGVSLNGFTLDETTGQSNYNSFQASVTERAWRGLQFQLSYAWSKSLDDSSGVGGGPGASGLLNTSTVGDTGGVLGSQLDPHANRGLSDFDRTHRFVASYVWDIPSIGSGNHARQLLRDWQASGVVTAMSGLPIDIVDSNAGSLYGLDKGSAPLVRPNLIAGETCQAAHSNIPTGYYFNPTVFADPVVQAGAPIPSSGGSAVAGAKGTDIGNVGRNCLRGPGQVNVDFGLSRHVLIREKFSANFRADFFNVLNHRNLANPVSNLNAAATSGGTLDPNTGAVLNGGNFGRIMSSSANPRMIMLSVSVVF